MKTSITYYPNKSKQSKRTGKVPLYARVYFNGPEELKNAKEIGDWMKINSEAIYNCEYAGWEKQDWGYYTKKQGSNKVYMIVYNVPVSGRRPFDVYRGISLC